MPTDVPIPGSTKTLTVATGGDAADVPAWLDELAKDVAAAIAERAGSGDVTALSQRVGAVEAAVGTLNGKLPARVKFGATTVDPDSAGNVTIRHDLGVIPSWVQMTVGLQSTANRHVTATVDTNIRTASTIGVNLWEDGAGKPFTGRAAVYWEVRA